MRRLYIDYYEPGWLKESVTKKRYDISKEVTK